MATENKNKFAQAIAQGMMAAGDAISGIYGQRGNTYGNYLESQAKRQAIESELKKAQQAQAMELYQKQQDSIATYAKEGMRPVAPNEIDRMRNEAQFSSNPNPMIQGAYGQGYVPSQSLGKKSLDEFIAKQDIYFKNRQALREDDRTYKASEASPMSADAAGRYEFANEALRSIPKLKATMFPDGTEKSYRRDIATKMMTPWKYPNDPEVQDAKRWVIGIATGRGLIQSGTVVKDNEWGRLMQQMGIDVLSAPKSVMNSLSEQEEYMTGFKENIKPGIKGKGIQTIKIGKDIYNVPDDEVSDFKKEMGIK